MAKAHGDRLIRNLDNVQTGIHDYYRMKYGFGRAPTGWCVCHQRRGRLARAMLL